MKDLRISKELFEAVYNCDITTDKDTLNAYKNINLYTFFFDCKEWAMNKGYQIISGLADEPAHRRSDEKAYAKINHYYGDGFDNLKIKYKIIRANIEVEAVLKASEYVLKELNENR